MGADMVVNRILDIFLSIAAIPRPSHHEEKIAAFLCEWAKKHDFSHETDDLGNVCITKPASPGCENAPSVILQAHMDMVCVAADGVSYDPLNDPIRVIRDGNFLRAEGTSLGADDGIGIALALYILEKKELSHGPLKALFTVDEEDGMSSGAIDPRYLDADYLINLDWEWLGSLCNSSAGGDFLHFKKTFKRSERNPEKSSLRIGVGGLLGGHSGVDIHRGRANGILLLAGLLEKLLCTIPSCEIGNFFGGQARNAIPASAEATIFLASSEEAEARALIGTYFDKARSYFQEIERNMFFICETVQSDLYPIEREASKGLLSFLLSLPNGVHTMSPYVKGLVESSMNLGILETASEEFHLDAMLRSSSTYRAEELLAIAKRLAFTFDFCCIQGEHSPAWAVDPQSRLTPLTCEVYKELTGEEMVVEPVHGALECGAFFEKNPRLDMIAIGPSLFQVHTPQESCDLNSVGVTAALLEQILARLTE